MGARIQEIGQNPALRFTRGSPEGPCEGRGQVRHPLVITEAGDPLKLNALFGWSVRPRISLFRLIWHKREWAENRTVSNP